MSRRKEDKYNKSGSNCYGQMYGVEIPIEDIRDTQWAVTITLWKKRGKRDWPTDIGSPPGEPGCRVPRRLLFATDAELEQLVERFREDIKAHEAMSRVA